MAKRHTLLLAFSLLVAVRPLLAGPPFQLDDPDVIPYQNFEFYLWGGATSGPGVVNTAGPAIEFNYSGVRNVMFHFIVPAGATLPTGGPTRFGVEDSEFGLQYRFIQETKHHPMLGTFVMTEIPTGNANLGLGAGGFSWKLPLYTQKSLGPWTIDAGGGETLNHNIPGALNSPFGGTLVTRDLSDRLTLGGEIFAHGRQTTDPTARYAAMFDFGGAITPTPNPDFQILFALGHSFAGQPESYSYVSLYWTGNLHKRLSTLAHDLHP